MRPLTLTDGVSLSRRSAPYGFEHLRRGYHSPLIMGKIHQETELKWSQANCLARAAHGPGVHVDTQSTDSYPNVFVMHAHENFFGLVS